MGAPVIVSTNTEAYAAAVRPVLGVHGAAAQVVEHGEHLREQPRAVDADELEQAERLLGGRQCVGRGRRGGERGLEADEPWLNWTLRLGTCVRGCVRR
ncbi:hypothetical protein ZWY2020_044900 [Hordeum vulgare]|nr:hypothetical protein ZWY2020_044900 [Hordeum vulgare]